MSLSARTAVFVFPPTARIVKNVAVVGASEFPAGANAAAMDAIVDALYRHLVERISRRTAAEVHLVALGQPWIAHAAVRLLLARRVQGLTLALPCEWDYRRGCFDDRPTDDQSAQMAAYLNRVHADFSAAVGADTLGEIHRALMQEHVFVRTFATIDARSAYLALCPHLVALTPPPKRREIVIR